MSTQLNKRACFAGVCEKLLELCCLSKYHLCQPLKFGPQSAFLNFCSDKF